MNAQEKNQEKKLMYEKQCIDILIKFLKLRRKTLSPLFEDFLYSSASHAKSFDSEIGKEIIDILENN